MEVDDDDSTNSRNKKPAAKAEGWTEGQGKNKTRSKRETISTPLRTTPPRGHSTLQSTSVHATPVNQPTNQPTPPQTPPPTTTLPGLTPVHLNDGTLRVTVRWKPDNFGDLLLNEATWNLEATDIIHYILATISDSTFFPG